MLDFLKKVLQIRWLWCVIAGFYLVAYAFWVPNVFGSNLPLMILALAITLALGLGLLADGFIGAGKRDGGAFPSEGLLRFAGGVGMLAYLLVYIPPEGRIVAHWLLDMATTFFAGFVMLAYGFKDTMDFMKKAFQARWLWSILGGFYLLVYAFWVPGLFSDLPVTIVALAITAITGIWLLADGFFTAGKIDGASGMPDIPFRRFWRLAGAALLLSYILIYLPPYGQITAVAHWQLDMAITIVSGSLMLAYGILDY